MGVWNKLGTALICICLFQNCSPFEGADSVNVYSYTEKPDFFYNVKLVSVETDAENREEYTFDFSVTFAENVEQGVSYSLVFSTIDIPMLCVKEGLASGAEKHFRAQCLLPVKDDLYFQLTLVGPTGEQLVERFKF